jgi:hypothetical protein
MEREGWEASMGVTRQQARSLSGFQAVAMGGKVRTLSDLPYPAHFRLSVQSPRRLMVDQ